MARRKNDTLKRTSGGRKYRQVCWVSTEGQTEKDYLCMSVFKGAPMAVKFPKDIQPEKRNPAAVLNRFIKAMRFEDFRKGDQAWLVVDIDSWKPSELQDLLNWSAGNPQYNLAISNPKFELFLVMHFERSSGCTTPQKVDEALKRHWPRYNKRIRPTQFNIDDVKLAIEHARTKRRGCSERIPAAGMTDMHMLVEQLIKGAS